ncbi:MAG TPA: urease accessory protein UreF, partial [Pseudomonadales bacterium]
MSINHDHMTDPLAMLRLLQLCSATLPVGAFSFSQGLEYAIDKGWLVSEDDVNEWLSVNLSESMAHLDIPVLFRMRLA